MLWIVNPNANIVVSLYLTKYDSPPKVAQTRAKKRVDIAGQDYRFVPHVSWIQTTQPARITNRMETAENPKFDFIKNPSLNPLLRSGEQFDFELELPERLPTPLSSSIHPWMYARIVVTNHPFVSVSDSDGKFRIEGLPPGLWKFLFWHERAGYVIEGQTTGGRQHWPKGRISRQIKVGRNDLGEIKLSPRLFKR